MKIYWDQIGNKSCLMFLGLGGHCWYFHEFNGCFFSSNDGQILVFGELSTITFYSNVRLNINSKYVIRGRT